MYSLEKRCLSQGELSNQSAADSISRDALTVGCHEAYDGLVVYCICQGDHCNKSPITLQLQDDPKYTTSDHDSELVALNPGISLQNMLGESDGDDGMTASSSVASKWQQNSWPNARATANLSNASASSGEVLSGTQNQQTQRMNSLSVPVEHFRRKDPEQRQLEALPKQQKEQQQSSRRQENNWLSTDANEDNDELLSLSSSASSTRPIHQTSVITYCIFLRSRTSRYLEITNIGSLNRCAVALKFIQLENRESCDKVKYELEGLKRFAPFCLYNGSAAKRFPRTFRISEDVIRASGERTTGTVQGQLIILLVLTSRRLVATTVGDKIRRHAAHAAMERQGRFPLFRPRLFAFLDFDPRSRNIFSKALSPQ
ncbi:unnamed protein product [Anisakis simplex]|uniref:Major sperm protein n=1 Tax=Anisakis simplex TaxID=6269 RepID=A0A0M3K7K0_ANISI|nr:unnamed protein product [Anisakis simplex]